jgi:hypothetical protein
VKAHLGCLKCQTRDLLGLAFEQTFLQHGSEQNRSNYTFCKVAGNASNTGVSRISQVANGATMKELDYSLQSKEFSGIQCPMLCLLTGVLAKLKYRRQALVTCLSKMQPWKQGSIVILVNKKTKSREKPNEQKTIQGRSSKVSDGEKQKN